MIQGRGVSGGIGIGPAWVWQGSSGGGEPARATLLTEAETAAEVSRLQAAVERARADLTALHADAAKRLGPETAAIMEAHLLMLDDPSLVERAIERIRTERLPAPVILTEVGEELAAVLAALDDPYLRERAADVRDVAGRVLRHLTGSGGTETVPPGSVLVADDVPPSELLRLPPGHLAGLALARGGAVSHTAILARAMQIPAVIGLGPDALAGVSPGVTLVVDGDAGALLPDPDPAALAACRERQAAARAERQELEALRDLPAETQDGVRITLAANIGSGDEAGAARTAGAEGVGLFRTELLFLDRTEPPGEEEQYLAYRQALEAMAPHPVLIRTLDIGGDKPLPYQRTGPEENPFLGWRGVRRYQDDSGLFRTQMRALLRAAAHGRLQVMLPMVSTRSEVEWVREQIRAAGGAQGSLEFGIMVETPAAALMADALAPLVDFFSIGTNDLTQYTLAVDRGNPKVAGLCDPLHPAVLRLIRSLTEGAHRHGKWAGLCGELAGDPLAAPLLLGLGVDELSVSVPQLGRVKRAIRGTTADRAAALAQRALSCAEAGEVRALLTEG